MCALNNETRSVYRGWLTKLHLGPAKKDTKRHTKHLVSVSMCYPRHLDGIPKKWPFSCHPLMICFWKVIDLTEGESINLILRQTVWTRFLTWWILQNSSLMYHIQPPIFCEAFWTVSWSSWYQPTWVKSVVWLSNEISSRNTTSFMAWIGFKPRLFLLEEIGLMYSSCLLIT